MDTLQLAGGNNVRILLCSLVVYFPIEIESDLYFPEGSDLNQQYNQMLLTQNYLHILVSSPPAQPYPTIN